MWFRYSKIQRFKDSIINICLLLFAFALNVSAKQPAKPSIFEALNDTTELTHGRVALYQDHRIVRMVNSKILDVPYTADYALADGFRVQVFSSNEQSTAKSAASRVEQIIQAKYPELPIYVDFQSPFWKVRVGNCATNAEARELRKFIQSEFPEIRNETYIVREQIRIYDPD